MPSVELIDSVVFSVWNGTRYIDVEYFRTMPAGYYRRESFSAMEGTPWTLHRAIWIESRGLRIPRGYTIHHIDENTANNNPKNLKCMEKQKHQEWHNYIGTFLATAD